MGFTTDFVGYLTIDPPLNDTEIDYLDAFGRSRRCIRKGDEYDVPDNPGVEESTRHNIDDYNTPPGRQPNLWCDWTVGLDGETLTWNGTEKSYSMTDWLAYLVDHFLKPGAEVAGDPRFGGFTFDHQLNGTVVGCRRDNGELFAIRVSDNHVEREVMMPGVPLPWEMGLPYQHEIDRDNEWRERRRRDLPAEDDVGEDIALEPSAVD